MLANALLIAPYTLAIGVLFVAILTRDSTAPIGIFQGAVAPAPVLVSEPLGRHRRAPLHRCGIS